MTAQLLRSAHSYDPSDPSGTLARLESEELELEFESFDSDAAWSVGSSLRQLAVEQEVTVAIAIHLGGRRAFHAGTRGTAPLHDAWLERKLRTARHYGKSTLTLRYRHLVAEESFEQVSALSKRRYTVGGGGVPLRTAGEIVGALAVSGLEMHEDHRWAIDALREWRRAR
jgi:uncharacterized protein (UPF0303 family)